MISFLAVIVLTKVYTGVYLDGKMQGVEKVSTQNIHDTDQDLNTAGASIESDEQENKT